VVSPSTVRRHQWLGISMGLMGRLLGLEVLVEGTVQQLGERLIVTARLVDVHTGKLIWAENYDYPAAKLGADAGRSRTEGGRASGRASRHSRAAPSAGSLISRGGVFAKSSRRDSEGNRNSFRPRRADAGAEGV